MRKIFLLLSFSLLHFFASAQAVISDSATMGPSYVNDVHYSLANGTVSTVPNNNWHLAFRSGMQSDGIFINSTAGVRAFLTNKSIAAWDVLDTNDATTEVFNTDTSWDVGAFNRTFDNPYCSWGTYNTITHKVTGDSLFLLKVAGNWIKLWVVEKDMGIWKVRIGTSTLDTTYTINNADIRFMTFGYLNLNTNSFLTREPADSTWDIKFTRYTAFQPFQQVYYPVTGVMNNMKVKSVKVTGVDEETYLNYGAHPMTNSISAIGADWKSFDNNTLQWKLADSTCYFVKVRNGDIWKMWFTRFGGGSSGKSYFNKQKAFTVSLGEAKNPIAQLAFFPNPAIDNVSIVLDNVAIRSGIIRIMDMQGKEVYAEQRTFENGLQQLSINVAALSNGIYTLSLESENYSATGKIVISK